MALVGRDLARLSELPPGSGMVGEGGLSPVRIHNRSVSIDNHKRLPVPDGSHTLRQMREAATNRRARSGDRSARRSVWPRHGS
jgi:hypothetical protein